ncbi:hypothetical protein N431DRAFT_72180 [Stipitochalara longipes BDJ]|nr:hypothetical protein N431DRAFT_72180 [Stipitochalara longipes BDJ]
MMLYSTRCGLAVCFMFIAGRQCCRDDACTGDLESSHYFSMSRFPLNSKARFRSSNSPNIISQIVSPATVQRFTLPGMLERPICAKESK